MSSFWLEFEQDGEAQNFPFESASVAIGRDKSSDFALDHPTISRQHALIVHDEQSGFNLVVVSRGGLTAINGQQVQGTVPLYKGDRIHLGKLMFRFQSQLAPERPGGSAPAVTASGELSSEAKKDEPKEEKKEAVKIASWDDIADSDAAKEESPAQQKARKDEERKKQAQKDSGLNPLVLVVVVLVIVGGAVFYLLGSGGGANQNTRAKKKVEAPPPVEISVDCFGEAECMRFAQHAYSVGFELLARRDVEVSNLFGGYKRLLEAEEALKVGEISELPDEMHQLPELKDEARSQLDETFQRLRVSFHQYLQVENYGEMVAVIESVKEYFPDPTAQEHRWAIRNEVKMKRDGTYPIDPRLFRR